MDTRLAFTDAARARCSPSPWRVAFISRCFAFFPRGESCPASTISLSSSILFEGGRSHAFVYRVIRVPISEAYKVYVIAVGLIVPTSHIHARQDQHTTSTMASDSCATCAQVYDTPSEKPLFPGRTLPCCSRTICARCLNQNKRYETYCPYCQITTAPSSLPQGLRDPPAYSPLEPNVAPPGNTSEETLPAYQAGNYTGGTNEKGGAAPAEDVLHFVAPGDSMRSLALAYDVPIAALRKTNNIYSDHLVQARKTILIPGEHYKGGISLSPRPLESEEDEIKKNKLRRWMMACKVAE